MWTFWAPSLITICCLTNTNAIAAGFDILTQHKPADPTELINKSFNSLTQPRQLSLPCRCLRQIGLHIHPTKLFKQRPFPNHFPNGYICAGRAFTHHLSPGRFGSRPVTCLSDPHTAYWPGTPDLFYEAWPEQNTGCKVLDTSY